MIIQAISPKKSGAWVLKATLAYAPYDELEWRYNGVRIAIMIGIINASVVRVLMITTPSYAGSTVNMPRASFVGYPELSDTNPCSDTPPIPSGYMVKYYTSGDKAVAVVGKPQTSGIYVYEWE